jgi:predicted CXXCH cytochrome family protein
MSEQTPQDIDALLLGQTKGLDAGRMNRRSFEIATREWARAGIVCPLLVVCAAHFVLTRQMHAEDTTEHPFIQASAIKSETCLTCHPNKKEGKFVHSAIAMGCEKCHRAISENGKTTITPVATGGELCAMCHDAKRAPVLHVPYREGQCLLCHEPHTSNFPRQVRAETNLLCLSCHVPHSSALPDLLPADVNNDFELCARCHK